MSSLDAAPADPGVLAASEAVAAGRPLWRNAAEVLGARALRWLLIGALASLTLALVELAVARIIQLFLKSLGILSVEVDAAGSLGSLGRSPASLAVILLVTGAVRGLSQFFVGSSATVAMEMINARLRRLAIFEMLLHSAERYVPASEVNARIGEYFVRASYFTYAATQVVAQLVQSCALACVMIYTGVRESLVAMLGLLVVGLVVMRLNRVNRSVAKQIPAELELLSQGIERIARNTLLVRALRTQRTEHARFAKSVDAYARHSVNSGYLGNAAAVLPPMAGIVLIVVIVGVSKQLFGTPGLALLSFLYLFTRFVQSLSAATSHFGVCNQYWAQFRGSAEYLDRFSDSDIEIAMQSAETVAANDAAGRLAAPAANTEAPAVQIADLSFKYESAECNVLSHVGIDVPPASQLAIVGASGCGKSTLLGLMMGLLTPTSGTVRIGGRDPRAYFRDGGQRIGYVGADAFLVAGTVRENLRYGLRADSPDAELWAALDHARLRSTVEGLPGKLDYVVGEDGSGLSAGQKQRLCLARALLSKPHLLVLDEASANLDEQTEMEIAASLQSLKGQATVLIVSHRPGILKYVDQTIALGPPAA